MALGLAGLTLARAPCRSLPLESTQARLCLGSRERVLREGWFSNSAYPCLGSA